MESNPSQIDERPVGLPDVNVLDAGLDLSVNALKRPISKYLQVGRYCRVITATVGL